MHKLFSTVAFILFVGWTTSFAQTKNFYVNSTPGVGNDATSNPGNTYGSPLKTIREAFRRVSSIPTSTQCIIRLYGQEYREGELDIPRDNVTMIGYGQPVLKGSVIVTGSWSLYADNGVRRIYRISRNDEPQQLIVDDVMYQQVFKAPKSQTNKLPYVMTRTLGELKAGEFYYDASTGFLYCAIVDGDNLNNHTVEVSDKDFILRGIDRKNITFDKLTLRYSNSNPEWGQGLLRIEGGDHWTITRCRFEYGDYAGIRIINSNNGPVTDIHIESSAMINNGNTGITLTSGGQVDQMSDTELAQRLPDQHITFTDLTITGNNYRGFRSNWHAGGLKILSCRGVTITQSEVRDQVAIIPHGNDDGSDKIIRSNGIWFDANAGDMTITDNIVTNNRIGIMYEISDPRLNDPYGIRIYNNRIYDNPTMGVYISAASGAVIEQNTFYNEADLVMHGMPRGSHKLRNNRAENNIFFGRNLDDYSLFRSKDFVFAAALFTGTDASNNKLDKNFYYKPAGGKFRVTFPTDDTYNGNECSSLSNLRARGHETNASSGEGIPKWVDAPSGNFALASGSPAQGKGWQGYLTASARTQTPETIPAPKTFFETESPEALLYPNPTTDQLNLTIEPSGAPSILNVYDLLGKRVLQHVVKAGETQSQISTRRMKPGVYYLEVKTAHQPSSKQSFIVQ